jgi:hypothetical protein
MAYNVWQLKEAGDFKAQCGLSEPNLPAGRLDTKLNPDSYRDHLTTEPPIAGRCC